MNIFRFKKLKTRGERSRTNWKIVLMVLLSVLIFGSGQIKITHAANESAVNQPTAGSILSDIASGAVYPAVYAVNYLMGKIGSVFFTFAAYLVDLALRLNGLVLNSPTVQNGWQIVLAFTNLGFVLAIIIMAFATIFRMQSYAMKQTLWKLIVAALLVNFSLVIAGAFISSADTITNIFNQQFKEVSLSTQLTKLLKVQSLSNPFGEKEMPGTEKYSRVVLKMLDSINPAYWLGYAPGLEKILWGENKSVFTTDSFIALIGSLFFAVLFTFLSVFVMLAIAIMLFIRYIYLGFLLILSPIVWLLWIFPATVNLWQKWWKKFIQWVFFAPIMMFFLFVAITSMNPDTQQITNADIQKVTTDAVQFSKTIKEQQTGLAVDLMKLGNMVIILGLMMGSLIAAQSLSIAGSKTAYGLARGAGKMFGGWVGRKTLEGTGRRILSSERVKGWTEKLSASKVPGARFIGQGINRLGAQVERVTKEPYEKLAKSLATNPERLNNEILASRGAKRAVLLSQAAKTKDIRKEVQERFINNPESYAEIEKEFKLSGLDFDVLQKAVGRSLKMVQAKTDEELKKATDEFVQSLTPKDYAKGQWNDVFKKTEDEQSKRIQESLATAFAQYEHGAYAKTIPNIKGDNLNNFRKIMEKGIETAKKQAKEIKDFEESTRVFKYASEAADRLGKTLNRRATFGEEAWVPPKEETT